MEAIIRTNDKNLFNSLIQFLKTLHLQVETVKTKKKPDLIKKPRNNKDKYRWENAKEFFAKHQIDLSNFKFNREEANER